MAATSKKWMIGGSVAAVAVLAGAWFFAIHPAMSHNSSTNAQVQDAEATNTQLLIKTNRLKSESKKLDTYATQLAAQRLELPSGSGLPAFIREVSKLADSHQVLITSFSPSGPTAISAAGTPSTASEVGSPPGTLFSTQLSMVIKGNAGSEFDFLAALQKSGSRAALVGSTQIAADEGKPTSTMTIALKVYTAPQTAAQQAALDKELATAVAK